MASTWTRTDSRCKTTKCLVSKATQQQDNSHLNKSSPNSSNWLYSNKIHNNHRMINNNYNYNISSSRNKSSIATRATAATFAATAKDCPDESLLKKNLVQMKEAITND